MTIDEILDLLITTAKAADVIGITKERLAKVIKDGAITAREVGQTYVMLRADVEAFAKLDRPAGRPRKEANREH